MSKSKWNILLHTFLDVQALVEHSPSLRFQCPNLCRTSPSKFWLLKTPCQPSNWISGATRIDPMNVFTLLASRLSFLEVKLPHPASLSPSLFKLPTPKQGSEDATKQMPLAVRVNSQSSRLVNLASYESGVLATWTKFITKHLYHLTSESLGKWNRRIFRQADCLTAEIVASFRWSELLTAVLVRTVLQMR